MQTDHELNNAGERRAYLVRLWRGDPRQPWRASLRQVSDGSERHFASPEELFLYLHAQTTGRSDQDTSA